MHSVSRTIRTKGAFDKSFGDIRVLKRSQISVR